jgi:hypothetical protein
MDVETSRAPPSEDLDQDSTSTPTTGRLAGPVTAWRSSIASCSRGGLRCPCHGAVCRRGSDTSQRPTDQLVSFSGHRRRSRCYRHPSVGAGRAGPVPSMGTGPARAVLHGEHRRHEREGAFHTGRLRTVRSLVRGWNPDLDDRRHRPRNVVVHHPGARRQRPQSDQPTDRDPQSEPGSIHHRR